MSQPDPAGELILEVTQTRRGDRSPLQYVTADMLAYYRRCEAELLEIKRNGVFSPQSPLRKQEISPDFYGQETQVQPTIAEQERESNPISTGETL